jgi:uncharacterized protein with beta-barrel porin domain
MAWTSSAQAECFRIGDVITCIDNVRGGVSTGSGVRVNIRPGAQIVNIPVFDLFGNCPISPPVIEVGDRSTVVNEGAMTGFGTCAATILTGADATVTNAGTLITVNNVASGIDTGHRGVVTNTGSITTFGDVSYGIVGGDRMTVTNGPGGVIETRGTAAAGIYVISDATVANHGLIRTNAIDAPAIYALADAISPTATTATIVNSGLLEALGARTTAVLADADTVTFTNSGQVRSLFANSTRPSDFNRGVNLAGRDIAVRNSGVIAGSIGGLSSAAAREMSFENSGLISAQADIGRAVELSADRITFSNAGTISGRLSGVRVTARSDYSFSNSGVIEITGGTAQETTLAAVELVSPRLPNLTLTNTGRISAPVGARAVRGGDADEAVINSGEITGDLDLGGGNDSLLMRGGGRFTGRFLGGAGVDRILLFDSGTVTWTSDSLEELLLIGDTWTVERDITATNFTAMLSGELRVGTGRTLTTAEVRFANSSILSGAGVVRGLIGGGGVIAPGPGVATLTIEGELRADAASVLRVDVGASGLSDRVSITGRARLDGALAVTPVGGYRFRGDESYEIITTTLGVTGSFARTTGIGGTFLTSTIVPSPDGRSISIRINRVPYASVTQNATQANVAGALDGALAAGRGGLSALTDQLDALDAGQARVAFDQLSTRMPSAVLATLDGGNRVTLASIPVRADDADRARMWGHANHRRGSPDRASYRFDVDALTAGLDGALAETTRIGILFSSQDGNLNQRGGTGVASLDQTLAAAYAIHQWRDVTFSGGLAWADGAARMRRSTALPFTAALQGAHTAKADTSSLGALIRASQSFNAGPLRVTARLGADAWRTTLAGFTETGPLALILPRQRMTSLRPLLGAEFSGASRRAAPFLSLTGSYELLDDDPISAAFLADPATRFAAPTVPARKTWLTTQAGVRASLSGTATLRLGFEGNLTDATQGHSVFAGFSLAF